MSGARNNTGGIVPSGKQRASAVELAQAVGDALHPAMFFVADAVAAPLAVYEIAERWSVTDAEAEDVLHAHADICPSFEIAGERRYLRSNIVLLERALASYSLNKGEGWAP